MKIKRPKNVRWCHPPHGYASAHRVQTGDNWWNLASKYGFADPWDIIQYNYGTKDPEEVNWYLQELVGCTRSSDALNYSFDSSDKFGTVFIPPKGWKPSHGNSGDYGFSHTKDQPIRPSHLHEIPYVHQGTICSIFNRNIFVVGDCNLKTQAEYNYGNIIFVRIPKESGRSGNVDWLWMYKEMIHLAYGAHGMKMPYSARTEAVALIGAMAGYLHDREPANSKLPFSSFSFSPLSQQEFFAAIRSFLAEYKKDRGSAKLDPIANLMRRNRLMVRRLEGMWPKAQAA